MRRFFKILLYLFLSLLVLVVLVPMALYIPAVQNYACSQAVKYLNEQSEDLMFGVGKIRIGFPLSLKVFDVEAISKKDSTLLFGLGKLQTGLDDFSLSDNQYLIEEFTLERIFLGFDTLTTSLSLNGEIEKIGVKDFLLDLNSMEINIEQLVINSPDLAVWVGESEPDSLEEKTDFEWKINLEKILAIGGHVKLDMSQNRADTVATSKFFDYNHLDLTGMALEVNDFVYAQELVSCGVETVTAKEENSGLEISNLQTQFLMQGEEIKVKNLDFGMPKSHIDGDFAVNLALLDSIQDNGYVRAKLNIAASSKDLITLAAVYVPEMAENWPEEGTGFTLDAYLTKDSLDVKDLSLRIVDHTDFKVEGEGLNIFDDRNRWVKAKIKGDLSDADFLLTTFVDKPENREYRLPTGLFAEIDATHWMKHTECKFFIQQDGVVVAEGSGNYDLLTEEYKLKAVTDRLKLSDFVPMTGIDGLSTHINVEGQHFDFPGNRTRLEIRAQLDTLLYNNGKGERDSLFDISIDATLKESKYFAQITSGHPYLMLDTQLEGIFAKDNVSSQGYIDMPKLNLAHLPQIVSAEVGEISMQSDLMLSYDYGENAFADIFIHTLSYDDGEKKHPFEEIDLRLDSNPDKLTALLESGDAQIHVAADTSIVGIMTAVDSLMREVGTQMENISLNLPAIQSLLPKMKADMSIARNNSFYPLIKLMGYRFQSVDLSLVNAQALDVAANVYGFTTDESRVDTVQFLLKPKRDKKVYAYNLFANYLAPKAQNSYEMTVDGEIHKDSITTCFKYENGKYITIYDIDAAVALAYDTVRMRFTEAPTIYAQAFKVNKNNFIQVAQFKDLASQALEVKSDLELKNDNGLRVTFETNKKDSLAGQDVKLNINNLDLDYLSKTLDLGLDIGGNLNSQCFIELLPTSLNTKINSEISSFHIGEYKAETLIFNGDAMKAKDMIVAGKLTIDQLVKLDINANICDSLDMKLFIHDLPLPLANAFMPSNMQLKGESNGEITIKGADFDQAEINGFITMHQASANYADCDATISFPEDTIRVRRNRIRFRKYALQCANKNPIVLDGSVSFREALDNPEIDLTITGEKTQIFKNKNRKNKQQYIYGTLPATIDMSIKGTVSSLKIDGNISALEGTNLTYYLEEDPLNSASKVEELVDFVRFREVDRTLADREERPYKVASKDEGVEVGLKLNIANNAKVYVHLPTNTNDHVNLIGGGSLQLTCEKNGTLVMSGMYDITGGDVHYKLPMIPMTKDFSLSDRSWISWNGDVADPNINLIAVERVKTTVNDDAGTRIAQFDVTINIAGTLKALDITFTCDAPEDGAISSEIASLTDEERSKQALLLLIAQTYMGPGTSSSMGLASANAALNSLLNKELGSMTSKMKYTDINVGIDTYDTDGVSRTDYSVKVSQRLFNDRMRVSVGGKISSGDNVDENNNEAMINDVSLEYLTKNDGSSYARMFRKTNYQNILEGEVVETGVGYVQQRSGFRFRNLFLTNKKREEALRQQVKAMQEAEREADRQTRRTRNNRTQQNGGKQKTDSLTVSASHVDSIAVDSVQFNK